MRSLGSLSLRAITGIPILSILILGVAGLGFYQYNAPRQIIVQQSNDRLQELVTAVTRQFDAWTTDIHEDLKRLAQSKSLLEAVAKADDEAWRASNAELAAFAKPRTYIERVAVADAKGEQLLSSTDLKARINVADRAYFKRSLSGAASAEIIRSKVTGNAVFLFSVPLRTERETMVLYCTVDFDKAYGDRFIKPVTIGQSGYVYGVNKDGFVVFHPDKSVIMKMDKSQPDYFNVLDLGFGRQILSADRGVTWYDYRGTAKTAAFQRASSIDMTMAAVANSDELFGSLDRMRDLAVAASTVFLLVVGVALFLLLHRTVIRPARLLAAWAGAVAGGDLSGRFAGLGLTFHGELATVRTTFLDMVARLRETVGTAEATAASARAAEEQAGRALAAAEQARREAARSSQEGVLHAADAMQGHVAVVGGASADISRRAQAMTGHLETQKDRLSETAATMEEIRASVLEVARNAAAAAQAAEAASREADRGAQVVSRSVQAIGGLEELTRELKANMARLDEQARDIGQVVNVINDIADQTNLLALNAAIEAARAGEAGRGFAVVADEVRKLAEKTMTATKEVGAKISAIQEAAQANIQGMEQSARAVTEATGLVRSSGEALERIVGLNRDAASQVENIASASVQQSTATDEIAQAIENVSDVAEESARLMTDTARSVRDLTDGADTLGRDLRRLKEEAEAELAALDRSA